MSQQHNFPGRTRPHAEALHLPRRASSLPTSTGDLGGILLKQRENQGACHNLQCALHTHTEENNTPTKDVKGRWPKLMRKSIRTSLHFCDMISMKGRKY